MTHGTSTIDVICDASVVLKWFHSEGESEVEAARTVLAAHRAGGLSAVILDLTLCELGNTLLRSLGWAAEDVADQLDDLRDICSVVPPLAEELRLASLLAERHHLTFYDAVYGAVARARAQALVTADAELVRNGLGERPSALVDRLGLSGAV